MGVARDADDAGDAALAQRPQEGGPSRMRLGVYRVEADEPAVPVTPGSYRRDDGG